MIFSSFTWPGMASILPARRGTQKEWITSRAVIPSTTGSPAWGLRPDGSYPVLPNGLALSVLGALTVGVAG